MIDMMATAVERVMAFTSLRHGTNLKPEDAMCCKFASQLRDATKKGQLAAVWFHPANELAHGHKTCLKSAIARAMGMHVGITDFVFLARDASYALEAKVGKGRLSPGQCDFQTWCHDTGVKHEVFTSVGEGIAFLEGWGLLKRTGDWFQNPLPQIVGL